MENIDKNFDVVERKNDVLSRATNSFDDKKIKLTEISNENVRGEYRKAIMASLAPEVEQKIEPVVEEQKYDNNIEMNNTADFVQNGKIEETSVDKSNHPIKLTEDMRNNIEDNYYQNVDMETNGIDVSKVKSEELAIEVEEKFRNETKNNGSEFYSPIKEETNESEIPEVKSEESKFDQLVADSDENKDVSFELENKDSSDINDDFVGFNFSIPSETEIPDNYIPEKPMDEKKIEEDTFDGTINDEAFSQNIKPVNEEYKEVESTSETDYSSIIAADDIDKLRQALSQERERKDALTKQLAEKQIAAEEASKDLQKAEETKLTVLKQYKENLEKFKRENEELESQTNKVSEETNATNSEIKATMDYVSSLNKMMDEIVGEDKIETDKNIGKAV